MIRYRLHPATLRASIKKIDPTWLTKTKRRSDAFIAAGQYGETSSLWSVVKPIYMKAQHFKCIFCERQFENEQYGKIEFDLEHFRPKSSVIVWPDAKLHPKLAYNFTTGDASDNGYYWLAYDPANYAASCKACNTALKSNYFPIGHHRAAALADKNALKKEKPFLCYPLGKSDDDPEDLITFDATIAVPKAKAGHKRQRGQIIIDFFDLNERPILHRQRAHMIGLVGGALLAQHRGYADQSDLDIVASLDNPWLPHAACIRAHKRLWQSDSTRAAEIYRQCRTLAMKQTESAPPDI